MKKFPKKYLLYGAWIQAFLALSGSLFFSEIWHLPPCTLCWYQRVFMYPLVLIIPIGIIRKDKNLPYYVLPLAIIGGVIAFFHNLLYYGVIAESQVPCSAGISCTTKFFEWFGFVTIPFLSFLAFVIISLAMFFYIKLENKKIKKNG